MLPIVTLLNGLGLVMIHRLDLANGRSHHRRRRAAPARCGAPLAVAIAAVVLVLLRDHRILRRYTYLAGAIGFLLLMLPLFPVIGTSIYGSRIWIQLGPFSFQPGEVAKIALAIFFAGYLVQTRDALSVAGRKVLGLTLPRGARPRARSSSPGSPASPCSSSSATSAPRCSSSASSSRCSTSPPSGCRGSRSA